jgi:hypothetical protein
MDPKTLGKWILRGWIAARRQGEGVGSCWIVRAEPEEQAWMRRLRRWLREHHRRSPPEELTHPSAARRRAD